MLAAEEGAEEMRKFYQREAEDQLAAALVTLQLSRDLMLSELAAELVPQAREMLSEKSQRGYYVARPRRERARGPRHLEERDGSRARDRRQLVA